MTKFLLESVLSSLNSGIIHHTICHHCFPLTSVWAQCSAPLLTPNPFVNHKNQGVASESANKNEMG